MKQFDIINYLSGLTTFTFDKAVLTNVALERGVIGITDYSELTQKDKDLCLADLLFAIYTGPDYTANMTNQHGAFSQTLGSQRYDSKRDIYNTMMRLYNKWEDKKAEEVPSAGLQWIYEYE